MNEMMVVGEGPMRSSLDFLDNVINPARADAGESLHEPRKFLAKVEDELDLNETGKKFRLNSNHTETAYYDLTMDQMMMIVLTGTLASIGTAGVPGAGLIMLAMVLQSVGLPLEGLALVAGIDRVLDMFRTTLNITGDAAVAVAIDATEKSVPTQLEITE